MILSKGCCPTSWSLLWQESSQGDTGLVSATVWILFWIQTVVGKWGRGFCLTLRAVVKQDTGDFTLVWRSCGLNLPRTEVGTVYRNNCFTAKLTANCLLSSNRSTRAKPTALSKEPRYSCNSRLWALSWKKTPKPADVPETVALIDALKTCLPQPVTSPFHQALWTNDRHKDTGLLSAVWYDRTWTSVAPGSAKSEWHP